MRPAAIRAAVVRGELAAARWLSPAVVWLRDRDLVRLELVTVVAFHGIGAVLIAVAPARNIVTPATAALFYWVDRPIWAVVFAAAAVSAAAAWRCPTGRTQLATWVLVFPTGAAWVSSFVQSLPLGGNAFGLVAWPVLLTLWAITALRLALRTGDECGRG